MATLRLTLAGKIAEVARLADEAGRFATENGLGADAVAKLLTVLDEVVTNIVTHGRVGEDAMIDVLLTERDGGLDVTVEDAGPPFDPLSGGHSPLLTASAEQRPVGGLGIYLLQRLTTQAAYVRTPQAQNRLSFRVE